ncbi:MAG: hypothetical protein QUV05_03670 [Phycisphaerae bacterium]|nr:hypothetical protein [Phycisphaerae bacterium]
MRWAIIAYLAVSASGLSGAPATGPASRPARLSISARLAPAQLERFDRDRAALAGRVKPPDVPYPFVRGVFHVHSRLSHDSRGTIPEIVAAAKATRTRIVGLTEHRSPQVDVIAENVKGWQDGIYFMAGTESNHTLHWPGREGQPDLRFVSHPEGVPTFERARFDGMEIYNTHSDAKDESVKMLLAAVILNLPAVKAHPEAAFASFLDYPSEFLARFDALTLEGPFAGLAANDSHQNQGFKVMAMPDGGLEVFDATDDSVFKSDGVAARMLLAAFGHTSTPEQPLLLSRIQVDPYEISMRHVGTFLQIDRIDERTVRHALRTGRIVLGFEIIAPLPAVGFWVERAGAPAGTVGDQIWWQPGLALRWALPFDADVRILRNGRPIHQAATGSGVLEDIAEGVYRLEAYLTLAGEYRPWVITNPVYVTRGPQ